MDTSTPTNSPYTYVDTSGATQTVQASSPDEALKTATNIAPDSGVQATPNQLINSSTQSRTQTNQSSAALDSAFKQFNITPSSSTADTTEPNKPDTTPVTMDSVSNDPYIQTLKAMSAKSDAGSQALISSILATKQNQQNTVNTQYDNYKKGLMALGIEHNEAQSSPDLLMGHIQQAENEHQSKLQTIEANTAKSLANAQTARDNGDFKTLNSEMAYIKTLNAQKQTELKNYYDTITKNVTVSKDVAGAVYDQFSKLNPDDRQAFIQGVAKQYNLPLGQLTQALITQKATEDKAALASENAQATLHNKLNPKSAGSKGGTDGTYKYTSNDLASYNSLLKSGGTGADGTVYAPQGNGKGGNDTYVDPGAYNAVYQEWSDSGGTNKGFLSKFPVKMVNPSSYSQLPAGIQPKKTKGS